MKRFFVRCVGQFLCVFGLTSIVSDVDADSYSCTLVKNEGSWYAGWATTGVSYAPWYNLNLGTTTQLKISGLYYEFSSLRATNPSHLTSSDYSTWDLCALPTDGYDYPISGAYQIRPGCAIRDSVLYSPKADVFQHYGCMLVDSPNGCTGVTGSTGTGSGSSGITAYTPPCCYMPSSNTSGLNDTVYSLNGQKVSVIPVRTKVVECTFNGCGAGEYYYTRDNTYSTITFRSEPGTFTFDGSNTSQKEGDGYSILTHIYLEGIGVVGSRKGYYYCTTRGCRASSHYGKTSYFDFYDIGHRCNSCNNRYSDRNINSPLNGNYTATLNWTTPADGTGEATCRLSSYQWTDDKGVKRIPCNNATPK